MDPSLMQWFEKLSTVGFPTLLVLVLFGNFMEVWMFVKVHRQIVKQLETHHAAEMAKAESAIAKADANATKWEGLYLAVVNPLEDVLSTQRRRQPRG